MEEKHQEVWLRMYEEQVRHGRHHEALRSQSTNLIIAISAALLAFLAGTKGALDNWYLQMFAGVFVIVINFYGLVMSLKHYERSRMHVTVAGKYRDVLSQISGVVGTNLNSERGAGKKKHQNRFSMSKYVRAYLMWSGLHLLLGALGMVILLA